MAERLGKFGSIEIVQDPTRSAVDGDAPSSALRVVEDEDEHGYRRWARSASVLPTTRSSQRRLLQLKLDVDPADLSAVVEHFGELAGDVGVKQILALERKLLGAGGDRLEQWNGEWETVAGAASTGERATVFIHGFASTPEAAFKNLPASLGGPLFALRHHTLGKSPIDNAIALANALPGGAMIDLVTHSRGGLVGELMCRANLSRDERQDALVWLARAENPEARALAGVLETLDGVLIQKKLRVGRFVRVACPAAGTSLVGRLPAVLGHMLNVTQWALQLGGADEAASNAFAFAKAAFLSIIGRGIDASVLPGVAAMRSEGPFVRALAATRPTELPLTPIGVAAAAELMTGPARWLSLQASRLVFASDHDFVVDTTSMSAGFPRRARERGWVRRHRSLHHLSYFGDGEARSVIERAAKGEAVPEDAVVRMRASSAPRGKVLLLPDASTTHFEHNGEARWPSTASVLHQRDPKGETWTAARAAPSARYDDLAQALASAGYELVAEGAIEPDQAVAVIGHGTGAARLPKDHGRALALGRAGNVARRRALLRRRLVELAPASTEPLRDALVERVVVDASEAPPPGVPVVLAAEDEAWPHRDRQVRAGATFGRLLADPAVHGLVVRFVEDATLPPSAPPRAIPVADGADIPALLRLPTEHDLVAAALGDEPAAPARPKVIAKVVHGALSSAKDRGDDPPTALVIPHYDGEPLPRLGRVEGWSLVERHQQLGVLPIGGEVLVTEDVAIVSLGSSYAVTARSLAAIVQRALLRLFVPREKKAEQKLERLAVGVQLVGSRPGEGVSVEEAAVAIAEGAHDAADQLGIELVVRITERHEDLAIRATRALARYASRGERIATEAMARGSGYLGARAASAGERRLTRWSIEYHGAQKLRFRVSDGGAAPRTLEHTVPSTVVDGLALVPPDLRKGATALELELDEVSASYAWESIVVDGAPLALRHPIVRRLRDVRGGEGREAVAHRAVVIGDPADGGGELSEARLEAMGVSGLLERAGYEVTTLAQRSGEDAVRALFAAPVRILHVAAHGTAQSGGKVALGGGLLLDGALASAMETCPTVVVLNACEAGRVASSSMSSLAAAFMSRGARVFVGAARKVPDSLARVFAMELYRGLLAGATLADAVCSARIALEREDRGREVWSAYQCYGDPAFTLRGGGSTEPGAFVSGAEVIEVAISIMGDAQVGMRGELPALRERAAALRAVLDAPALATGRALERVAAVHRALGMDEDAIELFVRALGSEEPPLTTVEYLADLLSRNEARPDVERAAALLDSLHQVHPTSERCRLLAQVRLHQGRADAALELYGRAAELVERERRRDIDSQRLRIWAEHQLARRALGRGAMTHPRPDLLSGGTTTARERLPALLADLATAKGEAVAEIARAIHADVSRRAIVLGQRATRDLLRLFAAIGPGFRELADAASALEKEEA
ncbi:CHAT domain-containing tetratricopeptide repeat protein [Sandaracinus amylolyticus]|nr:CHAT domain-containing protein [Sandaracinus amylolyticus]